MRNLFVRKLLFLLTLLLTTEIAFSENTKSLISEINVYENDSTFRISYLYENQKDVVLETKSYLKYGNWLNLTQTEKTFIDGICSNQIERVWKSDQWMDTHLIEFSKSDGQTIELFTVTDKNVKNNYKKVVSDIKNSELNRKSEYVFVDNQWVVTSVNDYVYVNHQLKDLYITLYNKGIKTAKIKNTYTYHPDTTVFSVLQQEQTVDTLYRNVQLTKWYYVPGTRLVSSQRSAVWNTAISNWENSSKSEYEYDDNGHLITELLFYWKSMFWEKSVSFGYEYDISGNLIQKRLMLPIYKQWRNAVLINYSDPGDKNIQTIESANGFWGGTKGQLVSSYIPFSFNGEMQLQRAKQLKIIYMGINTLADPSKNVVNPDNTLNVYPNPSNGIFYFNNSQFKADRWSVYSTEGSLIRKNDAPMQSGVIDITGFPKGIYVLKAEKSNQIYHQKLTIK